MSKPDRVDAPRMEFTLTDAVCCGARTYPAMALRACSLPDFSATALSSRSLTTAVNDVATAEVELEDRIRSVEAPSESDDVPPSGRKRRRSSDEST
eukprot:scaffold23452_cov170-Skeletonema_dohrnii-CCMP3373.AAC.1